MNIDFERCSEIVKEGNWFTNVLYDNAYELVSDKCFPIVIPSYNRPNNKILKLFKANNIDDYNYKVYYLVRESQKDEYEKAIEGINNISIITAQDDLINGAGKARAEIIRRFNENIFIFDDDILQLLYTAPSLTSNNTYRFGTKFTPTNTFRILAMWQLVYSIIEENYDNVVGSNLQFIAHTWMITKNHLPQYSVEFNRGPYAVAIIANAYKLKEHGLNYRDNSIGHEDLDMQFRCLMKKLKIVRMNFIGYNSEPPNPEFTNSASVKERYELQYELMKPLVGELSWIKTIYKKGLKQFAVDYKKYYESICEEDVKPNIVELLKSYNTLFTNIETVELPIKDSKKIKLF